MLGLSRYRSDSDDTKSEGDSDVLQMKIHSDSISSLYFDRPYPPKLYTTSYDERALLFDASQMMFGEFYTCDAMLFDVAYPKTIW